MKCRFCHHKLTHEFIDLVNAPPSNSFLTKKQLSEPEIFYPLKLMVCEECWLVQVDEYKKSEEIFNQNYAYFSSYSTSWLEHAKRYVEMIIGRFGFNEKSHVIEIASNDGYLLQYFQLKHIPVLGIEPATNVAMSAQEKGIETIEAFFGANLANRLVSQDKMADLIIGNNVFAHVPDVNDFAAGLKIALKDNGVITLEFPHLMQLIEQNLFDTIYHEHFSYFSFSIAKLIFEKHGLELFDVEQISTHGGSLRIYGKHKDDASKNISPKVTALLHEEKVKGMQTTEYYDGFQNKADRVKYDLIDFLIKQKKNGKKVAAYGAAAKGNTLLNYCGSKKDLIEFVVDASPHKQGMFLPGSHIPVVTEKEIKKTKPDFVIILPWNIKNEIIEQLSYIQEWGGKFVVPIPEIRTF
ncbi:MAG: class I SAM-dependent methyltransferase [Deltaproteobacteria bacterium]|nr:class I SAM-dependent methyltransferase [Deltaproteobacteria bacterium]